MHTFLARCLTPSATRAYTITSDVLAVTTVVSIVALILETVPALAPYNDWLLLIEWVAVVIFSLEYLGRLFISRPRHRYPLSFFGIIDLVSILPTLLGLGNWTFLKSARAIRIIRLLRMLRLAKLARQTGDVEESFGVFGLNIMIYGATLTLALIVVGTAIYLAEPTAAAFVSIPAGMWWALQVFLGGIPVSTPETTAGEVVYVLGRFIGLLLLGLLVGVVGNLFRAYLTPSARR